MCFSLGHFSLHSGLTFDCAIHSWRLIWFVKQMESATVVQLRLWPFQFHNKQLLIRLRLTKKLTIMAHFHFFSFSMHCYCLLELIYASRWDLFSPSDHKELCSRGWCYPNLHRPDCTSSHLPDVLMLSFLSKGYWGKAEDNPLLTQSIAIPATPSRMLELTVWSAWTCNPYTNFDRFQECCLWPLITSSPHMVGKLRFDLGGPPLDCRPHRRICHFSLVSGWNFDVQAFPTNRKSEFDKFQTRGCKSTMLIHGLVRHRGFSVSPQHYIEVFNVPPHPCGRAFPFWTLHLLVLISLQCDFLLY